MNRFSSSHEPPMIRGPWLSWSMFVFQNHVFSVPCAVLSRQDRVVLCHECVLIQSRPDSRVWEPRAWGGPQRTCSLWHQPVASFLSSLSTFISSHRGSLGTDLTDSPPLPRLLLQPEVRESGITSGFRAFQCPHNKLRSLRHGTSRLLHCHRDDRCDFWHPQVMDPVEFRSYTCT